MQKIKTNTHNKSQKRCFGGDSASREHLSLLKNNIVNICNKVTNPSWPKNFSFSGTSKPATNNTQKKPACGKDFVLINPYMKEDGGGGDLALGKSIAAIGRNEGCRVSIVPFDCTAKPQVTSHNLRANRTSSLRKPTDSAVQTSGNGFLPEKNGKLQPQEPENTDFISSLPDCGGLKNPSFIVAPVAITTIEELKENIDYICNKHGYKKEKIFLVEEMDLKPHPTDNARDYASHLAKDGFANVEYFHLGFKDEAIGYIPTDSQTINLVKKRARYEIPNLLDSYNIDIKKKDNIHVGYVSSKANCSSTLNFIVNTLTENMEESTNSHYIICLREGPMKHVPKYLKNQLEDKIKGIGYDGQALFGEATISTFNKESGGLKKIETAKGKGKRKVNIILSRSLPRNIFLDLIHLSRSGMMTGDQSLSEYISFKQEMPYLDQQPWKQPMVDQLHRMAEEKGLEEKITSRISGKNNCEEFFGALLPSNPEAAKLSPKQKLAWQELNEEWSARRADGHIRKLFRD